MGNKSDLKNIILYANSLYMGAEENKSLTRVYKEAKNLLSANDEIFISMNELDNPLYKMDLKLQIIDEIVEKINLSQTMSNLLKILAENKKVRKLQEILEAFILIYNKNNNIAEVNVLSTIELSEIQKQNLLKKLKKMLNKNILINYQIDEKILGGLIIKYDDIIIDASVQNKIKKLHSILKGNI